MAKNEALAREQWSRYIYCRDIGHLNYINKVDKCENYIAGNQWNAAVKAQLDSQRRPALTINKLLGTLSSILGEEIDLRSEIAFKARYGAPSGNADIMTKVFRYISDTNQLTWRRSDMFCDGAVGSRGYLDVKMDFDRSITGDVSILNLNPKNVIPDPDAAEYDPDEWNDVIVTKWMTADDIEYMYGKHDADHLRARSESVYEFGYDSMDTLKDRDRFGGKESIGIYTTADMKSVTKSIRVIDRQYRKLTRMKYFINVRTGDRKEIPASWDRNKIALLIEQQSGLLAVDETVGKRIRWTVTCEDLVLHDEWSPYRHFTVVPYFPYFRYGTTIGFIENLLDPQDLLNKTTSQELHVINTTANSGWKVKTGSLKNMSPDELEEQGAQTGIVMELDDPKDAEKILPNQVPQGLSDLSRKSENYIKSVSMRGDAQTGMTRADVSADQIEANNAASDKGMRKPLDNLKRSDFILARNIRDLVQEFFTDPRIMSITHNDLTGETQDIQINWPDPTTGEIQNDMTMGDYDITVISQPAKQSLEDSQFEQAAYMREKLGIPIPSEFIVENSRLINKTNIVAALKEAEQGQEAQAAKERQIMGAELQLSELKGEISKAEADALKRRAEAAKTLAEMNEISQGDPKAQAEMELEKQKAEQEMALEQQKHEQKMQIEREKAQLDMQIKQQQSVEDARLKRAQAIVSMRQQAAQPKQPQGAAA